MLFNLFKKKEIKLEHVDGNAVQLAKETSESVRFIQESNDIRRLKAMGLEVKGAAEMTHRILGHIIEERVALMVAENIMMENGTVEQLRAYADYQEKAGKAVKAYFEELASIKNEPNS